MGARLTGPEVGCSIHPVPARRTKKEANMEKKRVDKNLYCHGCLKTTTHVWDGTHWVCPCGRKKEGI